MSKFYNIKINTLVECIDTSDLIDAAIKEGNKYIVYRYNYDPYIDTVHLKCVISGEFSGPYFVHRFKSVKFYPNTSLFRELYPNAIIEKNFLKII
jgi:hypothetical protein